MAKGKKPVGSGRGTKLGGSGSVGRPKRAKAPNGPKSYKHPEAESLLRPDVGTQAQFQRRNLPQPLTFAVSTELEGQ